MLSGAIPTGVELSMGIRGLRPPGSCHEGVPRAIGTGYAPVILIMSTLRVSGCTVYTAGPAQEGSLGALGDPVSGVSGISGILGSGIPEVPESVPRRVPSAGPAYIPSINGEGILPCILHIRGYHLLTIMWGCAI
jgi:hypothetical protein